MTDGTTPTIDEIVDAIAAAGLRPPRLRILRRWREALRGAWTSPRGSPAGAAARKRPSTYLEEIAVRGDKIQGQLGFRPAVDLRTGWRLAAT